MRKRYIGWLITILLLGAGALIPRHNAGATAPLVVCIDAGHPSERCSGRTVQNGLREVDVNWAVAQALATKLRAHGVTVVMTKSRVDEFVTNRRRAEIANAAGAALFIRLHCDTGQGSGYTLYYPDRQGTVAGHSGPSAAVRAASRVAADAVHDGMSASPCALRDNGVRGERATYVGSRQGALTGSVFSQVPAVTIEMAVLSHRADAQYINSTAGRDAMAASLAGGVLNYLQTRR